MERKRHITIKGHRSGIAIHVNARSSEEDVMRELDGALTEMRPPSGQIALVLHFGTRYADDELLSQVRDVVARHGVFYITEWTSDVMLHEEAKRTYGKRTLHFHQGTIRSGQTLTYEGSVVVVGDMNPGSELNAHGSVYCLGTIRGNVRAGVEGDGAAVIMANSFDPRLVSIGGVPFEIDEEASMEDVSAECAVLTDKGVEIIPIRQALATLQDSYAMELQRG